MVGLFTHTVNDNKNTLPESKVLFTLLKNISSMYEYLDNPLRETKRD